MIFLRLCTGRERITTRSRLGQFVWDSADCFLLGTEELQTVSEESDLGVIVLENLKASEQCIKVVNTADSILGMIRRGMTKYRKGPQRSITKTA